MLHKKYLSDDYLMQAANISLRSENKSGSANLAVTATGSDEDGNLRLSSNGVAQMVAGSARVSVDAAGAVSIDGGSEGVAGVATGSPVMPQTIILDGSSQSIKIRNGPLPVSPTIELTPESIKFSVGPMSGIEITAEGVTIKGMTISINATLEATVSALTMNVEGEAMAGLKAPLVQIGP